MLSKFELATVIAGFIINGLAVVVYKTSLISTVYSLMCIINAIFNAQGKIISRYFDIFASVFYIIICIQEHLYASIVTSVFVIGISIYGIYSWTKNKSADSTVVEIATINNKEILLAVASQIILFYPYYLIFKAINAESLFLTTIDLCITVLAHFLLSKRSNLAFLVFFIKDILLTILWIPPVLKGDFSNVSVLISMVYYIILDAYGYINWIKINRKQKEEC